MLLFLQLQRTQFLETREIYEGENWFFSRIFDLSQQYVLAHNVIKRFLFSSPLSCPMVNFDERRQSGFIVESKKCNGAL